MIIDKIDNWQLYFEPSVFSKIFKELENYTIDKENGVYHYDNDFYIKVMSYETKQNPTIIESHIREVDIQILLKGAERIKIYGNNSVTVSQTYDEETDCQFYNAVTGPVAEVYLKPGYMAIFFPDDIHHPQFAVNNTEILKKIVIKVNEKLFTQ